jgi:hypothetical protein
MSADRLDVVGRCPPCDDRCAIRSAVLALLVMATAVVGCVLAILHELRAQANEPVVHATYKPIVAIPASTRAARIAPLRALETGVEATSEPEASGAGCSPGAFCATRRPFGAPLQPSDGERGDQQHRRLRLQPSPTPDTTPRPTPATRRGSKVSVSPHRNTTSHIAHGWSRAPAGGSMGNGQFAHPFAQHVLNAVGLDAA